MSFNINLPVFDSYKAPVHLRGQSYCHKNIPETQYKIRFDKKNEKTCLPS